MKDIVVVVIAALGFVAVGASAAVAEDACPDPWAKVQGTYKCEGPCSYTASVCELGFYATGYKRWRFSAGQNGSATGVLEVKGSSSINFATTSTWSLTAATTSDCGSTIQFDGVPKGVTWRRLDDNPRACGSRSGKRTN